MSLQPRTTAPGKARRAAKGKPRHTSAQKAAKKAVTGKATTRKPVSSSAGVKKAVAKKSTAGKPVTKRYSDNETSTKKEVRLADRSKLRAQRFQERTSSKSKNVEGAPQGNPRQSREERTFVKGARPFKKSSSEKPAFEKKSFEKKTFEKKPYEKPLSRAAKFVSERSETRPSTRREAAKAKFSASDDGRPNFIPQKREKFNPSAPRKAAPPKKRTTNSDSFSEYEVPVREYRSDSPRSSAGKPPRDRRNNDFTRKTHSNAATDFGADDNYISENLADANLIEATPNTEVTVSFRDLGIAPALSNALNSQGITQPFPIQIATLPDALAGHDILGRGQTGSGKTLAFSLALLTNISNKEARPHKPLALILTPTRELAQQIDEVLRPLARAVGHESVVIAGGMPYAKQLTAMRRATAILVATPGRLIDLLNKNEVQLDQLQITVLDEADQMADMGFLPVVKEILDQARLDGQRLLFSATLDRGVDSLVKQYLKNPKTHSLQNDRASVSTMEHHVLMMHPGDKDDITAQIASRNGKTILFVKTQRGADRLADKLANAGVPVGALHGGKSQAVRTRTLALFKESDNAALVATDVAARGIHVDGISLVVHVDLPQDHKDYLHRSGRTARAGESGTVVTLSSSKLQRSVTGLLSRAGVSPKFHDVRPLDRTLLEITGAQEPTGIPYVPPIVERKGPQGGGNRRGGSGGGGGYRGGNRRRGR